LTDAEPGARPGVSTACAQHFCSQHWWSWPRSRPPGSRAPTR
jgi:hypothetical protein